MDNADCRQNVFDLTQSRVDGNDEPHNDEALVLRLTELHDKLRADEQRLRDLQLAHDTLLSKQSNIENQLAKKERRTASPPVKRAAPTTSPQKVNLAALRTLKTTSTPSPTSISTSSSNSDVWQPWQRVPPPPEARIFKRAAWRDEARPPAQYPYELLDANYVRDKRPALVADEKQVRYVASAHNEYIAHYTTVFAELRRFIHQISIARATRSRIHLCV